MMPFIPYGKQSILDADIRAVLETLQADYLTQGPAISKFEEAIAEFVDSRFAVAVANGTAGLHLACLALGIEEGSAVFVPAITFAATANAVLYCGGTPVFVDIDPKTHNMCPQSLEAAIEAAKARKLRPHAVVPVHFAGLPCGMSEISNIARIHNMAVIEDACHALGAEYSSGDSTRQIRVGGAVHSSMVVFSFHPVKHVCTGEGGAITTNDPRLAKKLRMLRSHGITKDPVDFIEQELAFDSEDGEPNAWYQEMQLLGYNYRLTDIQATLGLSQLKSLPASLKSRRRAAAFYSEGLSGIPHLSLPECGSLETVHAFHLYPIRLDYASIGKSRNQIMQALKDAGIGTQVHYVPVFWHSFYATHKYLWIKVPTPNAEEFYQRELSIPMYGSLMQDDLIRVVHSIRKVVC